MPELKLVHIAAGAIAITAGFVALYALKGARLHRKGGMVFVIAMMLMTVSAVTIATTKSIALAPAAAGLKLQGDALGGVLTFYLVVTGLLTVRRFDLPGWVDSVAMLVALAVGVTELGFGFEALASARGTRGGYPAPLFFIFGGVALLAALGDARMILARGIQGARRVSRHLWRMGLAMFIATGSFFLGQQQVIPAPLRVGPLLAIPVVVVVVLVLYWFVRVRFTKWTAHATRRAGLQGGAA